MDTIILKSNSKDDLSLLVQLAKKLGIEVSVLTKEADEDIAMINAMNTGKTNTTIGAESFIRNLKFKSGSADSQ